MIRRLILGLVLGLMVGGAVAFGLVKLDDSLTFGGVVAYLAAAIAGAGTGAVAGKPIWASGAKIEAGLKSFFGALLAAGGLFALQRWGTGFTPSLAAVGGDGTVAVGDLPLVALPLVAGVLGALFGLDNTDEPAKDDAPRGRKRVASVAPGAAAKLPAAAASDEEEDGEDRQPGARRAKH
jgi:hypothetical protein